MGLLTRAAVPSALKSTKRKLIKPSLGNLKSASVPGGKGRVSAGTQAINYVSEGTPLNVDWEPRSWPARGTCPTSTSCAASA